eukprot:1131230_1
MSRSQEWTHTNNGSFNEDTILQTISRSSSQQNGRGQEVMPELDAFASFCCLINTHFPTYFYSDRQRKKDLIGAYAGSYLSWDILKICDREVFNHLKALPAHTYFFPLVASFQAIAQPFTQLQRLWDFLFCFGVHLNPVLAAAQIIINKKSIIQQNPARLLQGLLSQRKWMNQRLDAKAVIDCAMHLIVKLKNDKHYKLWKNITLHSSNFEIAIQIKIQHENGISSQMYKTITTATHYTTNANNAAITNARITKSNANHCTDKSNKFKTKSEENFGNIAGSNSLRQLIAEEDTHDLSDEDDDLKDDQ